MQEVESGTYMAQDADTEQIRVLLVEDNPGDARLVEMALSESSITSFEITIAGLLSDAIKCLHEQVYDIALVDLSLPDSSGLSIISKILKERPKIPIIVLTGLDDEEVGLSALKKGAEDYLVKGPDVNNSLTRTIRYAIERKKSKAELKTEREKYENVVKSMGEGLFVTDKHGFITYINLEAERITGYKSEEIFKKHLITLMPKELQKIVIPGIYRMAKGAPIRNFETRFVRKNGSIIFVELTVSANMEDGRLTEVMGVIRDITERKNAEEELITHRARIQERTAQLELANQTLSQSEERYRMLIENANDCIFHLDKSLRIIDVNKKAVDVWGGTKRELIGKNAVKIGLLSLYANKKDLPTYMKLMRDIIGGKLDNIVGIETKFKNKDGEEVFFDAGISIARKKGAITGMLVIARDVTERKKMGEELKRGYEELKAREQQLQVVNEQMEKQNEELEINYQELLTVSERLKKGQDIQSSFSDVISMLNSTINFQELLNLGLEGIAYFLACQVGAIYLYEEETNTLKPYVTYGIDPTYIEKTFSMGEGTVGQTAKEREKHYITNIPDDINFVVKTITGDILPKCILSYPIIYQGELLGVIEIGSIQESFGDDVLPFIDSIISQLAIAIKNSMAYENIQKLAEELDAKNKEIQEANRLKSEFLANMSHELRTPMNSIMGFTNRVLKKAGHLLPERQYKNLEAVSRNAHNLLTLINDILDISKIEAGKMEVYPEKFSIVEVVGETVDAIMPLATDKNIDIIKDIENITAFTDKSKIKQIITNLLGNACKFTNEGEIRVLARDLRNGFVQIIVKDTGIGIKEKDLENIFCEFRQVDGSSTRKEGGTGLGLAITKKFSEMLGGTIEVESEFGVGSSFILTIPTKYYTAGQQDKESKQSEEAEEKRVEKAEVEVVEVDKVDEDKLTVLCIDDEEDVRELLHQYLSDEKYNIVRARDGPEGIKKAKSLNPFLITLDIMMPDMSGWEVISHLKQDPETVNIPVIIISILDEKKKAYSLGASDYVLKPIEQTALINSINNLYLDYINQVLLVEDDNDTVNLISETLNDRNISVRVAINGIEGLRLLKEHKPQLILLDLMMPELDGFGFIEEMKNIEGLNDIPIIVLTAKKLTNEEKDYLNSHVHSILEKSESSMKEVLDKISYIIRHTSKEVELKCKKSSLEVEIKEKESESDLKVEEPEITVREEEVIKSDLEVTCEVEVEEVDKDKLTVLCIDDEQDVRELIKQYLIDEGYNVIQAKNGSEGIKKAKELHPFLITLDVMMPDMNGWQTLSHLKEDEETANIPVIMISIIDDKNKAFRLGARDYVPKPIDQLALIYSINNLCFDYLNDVLFVGYKEEEIDLITEILNDRNVNVQIARNSNEGLDHVKDVKPQLILLDLMKKDESFGFIEDIKKLEGLEEIPIIALTSEELTDKEIDYLNTRVNSTLKISGFDKNEILKEISSVIQKELLEGKKDKKELGVVV